MTRQTPHLESELLATRQERDAARLALLAAQEELAHRNRNEVERMLRDRRIQGLSQMAAGLAHEISNPLAIIYGLASDLERTAQENVELSRQEIAKVSGTIVRTAERAMRILKGLQAFAREGDNDPMEFASPYEIVEQAMQLQEGRFARHGIALTAELEAEMPLLLCREVQIGQILTNLLNNAFDAIVQKECSTRWVRVEMQTSGGNLEVEVTDSGSGIDDEAKQHLMEPFFTTKPRGLGMGVGLSLSRAIAERHGGSLELIQDRAETCFRLTLPLGRTLQETD